METYFPNIRLRKLEQNYRSTKVIVNASNSLVAHNQERIDKTSFTDNVIGHKIVVHEADDDGREADFVRDIISRLKMIDHLDYKDFYVLYRTNRQSQALEASFVQAGIPYQVVGGHAFNQRKEIKDIVSYLRAIYNDLDALAFERIINVPKRGIGKTTIDRLQVYAEECMIPFPKVLERIESVPKMRPKTIESIKGFNDLLNKLRQLWFDDQEHDLALFINHVIKNTGYLDTLDNRKSEDRNRLDNLNQLINVADQWQKETDSEITIENFLNETSLSSDIDEMDDEDQVCLMTSHASKGLQNKVVFIVGAEEKTFPHALAFTDEGGIEEERRLFYVAMTRAEDRLFITHCRTRYNWGDPKPIFMKPSRFLKELPEELVQII